LYYQGLVEDNPEYELAGVFADQGITGTKDDRLQLVINTEQAGVVKRIFEDYIGGKGSFIIVKDLQRGPFNPYRMWEMVK